MTDGSLGLFLNTVVVFFVFLGWAVIFFPLARRFRNNQVFLVFIPALITLLILIAKNTVCDKCHLSDKGLYQSIGVFFGIAAIVAFYNVKSSWLGVSARTSALYRNGRNHSNVHLRHVLYVGMLMEERGKNFYEQLADMVQDEKAKLLCAELAETEMKHKKHIEKVLAQWSPLPIDAESMTRAEQALKNSGIYLDLPPMGAAENDIIKYAIEQERKQVEFYRSFESAFPEGWKKMSLELIVQDEKAHLDQLSRTYPDIRA